MEFLGIEDSHEFRQVRSAHVVAFRKELISRDLCAATIRRKLSAISSLFDFLVDRQAMQGNPCKGVKRPREGANEGKTPAISDAQARMLLEHLEKGAGTLIGSRDLAIIHTFLHHGLRCSELIGLTVGDIVERRGVKYLRVFGKGAKVRYLVLHPATQQHIATYLERSGHGHLKTLPLFLSARSDRALDRHRVLRIVWKHAKAAGLDTSQICVHALRSTAATNALEHDADIARTRDWLGHSDINTTAMYDYRKNRPEESPTLRVGY